MTSKYDEVFQFATDKYLHGTDWRWLKAQGIQESRLDPNAESHAGAQGLMQFMPKTWAETAVKLKWDADVSPFSPEQSIHAGAYYMSRLIGQWRWERPKMDRYCLALASYNAGLANILKAQRQEGSPILYGQIIRGLPAVTGIHSVETIGYVGRIFNHYRDQVISL